MIHRIKWMGQSLSPPLPGPSARPSSFALPARPPALSAAPRLVALKNDIEKEVMSETYRTTIERPPSLSVSLTISPDPELQVRWMGEFARLEGKSGGLFDVTQFSW